MYIRSDLPSHRVSQKKRLRPPLDTTQRGKGDLNFRRVGEKSPMPTMNEKEEQGKEGVRLIQLSRREEKGGGLLFAATGKGREPSFTTSVPASSQGREREVSGLTLFLFPIREEEKRKKGRVFSCRGRRGGGGGQRLVRAPQ